MFVNSRQKLRFIIAYYIFMLRPPVEMKKLQTVHYVFNKELHFSSLSAAHITWIKAQFNWIFIIKIQPLKVKKDSTMFPGWTLARAAVGHGQRLKFFSEKKSLSAFVMMIHPGEFPPHPRLRSTASHQTKKWHTFSEPCWWHEKNPPLHNSSMTVLSVAKIEKAWCPCIKASSLRTGR